MRAREVLLPGGMNPVFFGLKRAYHSTLRIGRANFRALQLTAARFDLLYALTDRGRPRNEATRQSVLRRMLGVSRPTVSRMLRSLEELGFVRRQRSEVDRRQLEVRLTGYGRGCVRAAFRSLVRTRLRVELAPCDRRRAAPLGALHVPHETVRGAAHGPPRGVPRPGDPHVPLVPPRRVTDPYGAATERTRSENGPFG